MRTYTKQRYVESNFEVVRFRVMDHLLEAMSDERCKGVTIKSLVECAGVSRTTLVHYLAAMEALGDIDMAVYKVENGGHGEARCVTLVALPYPSGAPMDEQIHEDGVR